MPRINLLFVCSRNRWRSPTAQSIYRDDPRFDVRSCGVSPAAKRTLTGADLVWADIVFVMEKQHLKRMLARHAEALGEMPVNVLDIPDEYESMDPELIDLIKDRVDTFLIKQGKTA